MCISRSFDGCTPIDWMAIGRRNKKKWEERKGLTRAVVERELSTTTGNSAGVGGQAKCLESVQSKIICKHMQFFGEESNILHMQK